MAVTFVKLLDYSVKNVVLVCFKARLLWYVEPSYIFFVEGVKDFAFCPNFLGTDAGTENDVMTSIQCALREGTAAHKYGSLIADQRIGN